MSSRLSEAALLIEVRRRMGGGTDGDALRALDSTLAALAERMKWELTRPGLSDTRATPPVGRTIATGRAGSRAPISEAAPRGRRQS